MTLQEAIDRLKTRDAYGNMTGYTGDYQEVLDIAQRGLEVLARIAAMMQQAENGVSPAQLDSYNLYFTFRGMQHILKEVEGK